MSQTSPADRRSDGARSGAAAAVRCREILGIPVAMVDYDGALTVMEELVERREPGFVCVAPVMSLVVAQDDPLMRRALTEATLTVPDGMPVVWAANRLGERLADRVYGPGLMDRYCARCAQKGHRVWLYGGRDERALAQLVDALQRRHPSTEIAGGWSPPFRPLTPEEEDEVARRIDAVTAEGLRELAGRYLRPAQAALAAVGPEGLPEEAAMREALARGTDR